RCLEPGRPERAVARDTPPAPGARRRQPAGCRLRRSHRLPGIRHPAALHHRLRLRRLTMRWFHLACAGLFAVSALLQYNDPDPVAWVLMWGAAAVVAVLNFRGKADY